MGLAVDLGSGGGLPGLVLALQWPETRWLLVDSNARRAAWLREAVPRSSAFHQGRVFVVNEPNLQVGGEWRETAALVTARGFGLPAATAECAAPLLRVGGRLLVAEPPERQLERWPREGLAELGLELVFSEGGRNDASARYRSAGFFRPRVAGRGTRDRVGIPFKRPLF